MEARARFGILPFLVGVFSFMPYVSPGTLLPVQVQPWAPLIGWWGFILLAFQRKTIQRDVQFFVLIFLALSFMVYASPYDEADILTYLRKTIALFLSLGIMAYAPKIHPLHLARGLRISTWLYLFYAVLQYVSTSLYVALALPLVEVRNVTIGERGAASLAPEATDFGFTMAYLLAFTLLVRKALQTYHPTVMQGFGRYLIPAILLCILLSKSASGVMAGALVLMIVNSNLIFRTKTMFQGLAGIAVVVIVILLLPQSVVENFRGLRLLLITLTDPELLLQTSFAHRAVHNITGIIAFFESRGMGYGSGSFTVVAPEIYQRYGLGEVLGLSDYHQGAVFETLRTVALGVVPLLLTEFGIMGLAFIVIVFWRVLASNMHYKFAIAALMLLTWLQSFPSAYPMFWLFAGLAANRHFSVGTTVTTNASAPAFVPKIRNNG